MSAPAPKMSDRNASAALEGRLSAVSLFDLCQFLMLNRKTGNLTVRSGARTAYFTFREGQLMTALDDALREGEAVVLQAVQWHEGSFEFQAGPVPPERRIEASTENILLEAARQLDEIRAGASAFDDEEPVASREEAFRRKQEKAASLSEAFRDAVSQAARQHATTDWKESVLCQLETGDLTRAVLTPGGEVFVTGGAGVFRLDGVAASDVREWREELWPSSHFQLGGVRAQRDVQGRRLWLGREMGPEGEGLTLGVPRAQLPDWEELGLTEDLAQALAAAEDRPIVVAAPDAFMVATALATWMARRGRSMPALGWVLEPWPLYDWTVLPGRMDTLPASSLVHRGDLARIVHGSGTELLVLRTIARGDWLREALELGSEGIRVVLGVVAESFPQLVRRLEASLSAPGISGGDLLRDAVGGIWLVRRGAGPLGMPWQSGFMKSPDADKGQSSSRVQGG